MQTGNNIRVLKNPYNNSIRSASIEPMKTEPPKNEDRPHYYGSIKSISNVNDVTFLARGSVYFLRDNPANPDTSFHPYVVIQDKYLDKIGKIAVFGITSTPSSINMIPVVVRGTIGYIDPHQPYVYKDDEFFEPTTRFQGTIANQTVMDLICNFYGLYLGMDLKKSEGEIIEDYLTYIREFKERAKNLKPYKHKILEESKLSNIEFKTSYDPDFCMVDPEPELPENFDEDIEGICDMLNKEQAEKNAEFDLGYDEDDGYEFINDEDNASDDGNISGTCEPEKPMLEIFVDSQAILGTLSVLENKPVGEVTLPRKISDMTEDDIKVFMACHKINGTEMTALIYNSTNNIVLYKKKGILEKYDVIYK